MRRRHVRISKFLSLVLRHNPGKIGLSLDRSGWVSVDELLAKADQARLALTEELLHQVVEQCDKQRFSFSEDGQRIRANYGHSIPVELGLEPLPPPAILYHGTATRFVKPIKQQGLVPRSRNCVHLSSDRTTAVRVGQRHGDPVVLVVQAGHMHERGIEFHRPIDGLWLTREVPAEYILFPETAIQGSCPIQESSIQPSPRNSAPREPRLGIDFGGVIMPMVRRHRGEDIGFGERFLQSDPQPAAFEKIGLLVQAFKGNVWIVSKAGRRVEALTRQWLAQRSFFEITDMPEDHVRFCRERPEKAPICSELGITHFLDDRIHIMQVLRGTVEHLYLYGDRERNHGARRWMVLVENWDEAQEAIVGDLHDLRQWR